MLFNLTSLLSSDLLSLDVDWELESDGESILLLGGSDLRISFRCAESCRLTGNVVLLAVLGRLGVVGLLGGVWRDEVDEDAFKSPAIFAVPGY